RPANGVSPLMIVAGIVFLSLVFVAGGGEEEASDPAAGEATEQEAARQVTTPEETEPEDEAVVSVEEPVTVGDVQWAVIEAQYLERIVSRMGSEEGNFVMVDVALQNNSNQDITLATPFMTLVDSQGREFEADQERNFTHLDPEKNMFVDQIEPGSIKEGRVIFAVAPDSSNVRLKVGEGRFASDETSYINLGL
ncbi:MAG TPA: DUF4352 domain-containing protein, partial [Rubrobacteraceae bacterium]|nr:DUF4352 domain-containing protein [Rubrobacteraceae bacterium]